MDAAAEKLEALVKAHFPVDAVFVPWSAGYSDIHYASEGHGQQRAEPKVSVLANEVHFVYVDFVRSMAAYCEGFWDFSKNFASVSEADDCLKLLIYEAVENVAVHSA